jgi:hypothetical protein
LHRDGGLKNMLSRLLGEHVEMRVRPGATRGRSNGVEARIFEPLSTRLGSIGAVTNT